MVSRIQQQASARCQAIEVAAWETFRPQASAICNQLTCMVVCLQCLLKIISLTLLPSKSYELLSLLNTACCSEELRSHAIFLQCTSRRHGAWKHDWDITSRHACECMMLHGHKLVPA